MNPQTPRDETQHIPSPGQHIVIIEDDEALGRSAAAHIGRWYGTVHRLPKPDDDTLRQYLEHPVDAVAVVSRDDIVALRYALLAEHIKPGIRLVVTLFDRTVAAEVSRTVPNCTVLSMTDAIVPSLLAGCLAPSYAALQPDGNGVVAVRRDGGETTVEHLSGRALSAHAAAHRPASPRAWLRSLGTSAKALVASLAALSIAFSLDIALGVTVLHEHWSESMWNAARALTTIGSSPAAEHGPAWYKVVSAVSMLIVLVLAAIFTASVVDRFTGHRMTSILGARSIPRRGHVIVVGLGQVGLRLSVRLKALGVKVVAVERNAQAECLPLARSLKIPVVLGRGGDRFLLERLSVRQARGVAAVGSDSLENMAVAVAARAVAHDQRIILRAGSDEVSTESQVLFRIGAVCDFPRIVGAFVAASVLGAEPSSVFVAEGRTCALFPDGQVVDLATWDTRDDDPQSSERESGPDLTPSGV
ncbi:NAD-binding protein [Streptomyces sp. NPDC046821]|uniref:NAD-binding protein n=1 Tax=Streptomyces sp. NPDC046821 TaxID=3154702 RepID=UPI0033D41DFA